jgi:hypothetical protein
MSAPSATAALVALGSLAIVVAALCVRVKVRSASRRGLGVRVCDLGADVVLPRGLHSRSYQIAFYLTMKSLPREPAAPAPKVNGPVAMH